MIASSSVVVVTGGAGGIAAACARRLAGPGVHLLLADLDEVRLAAAATALAVDGATVATAVCDAGDPASVAALADDAAALGPLGALVHTAGLAPPGASDPGALLAVNFVGTALLLRAFEPLVVPGSVGALIASLAGHRRFAAAYDDLLDDGDPWPILDRLAADGYAGDALAAYSVSKRGVIRLAQQRAAAWGARGGRLASVSPGLVVDTDIGALAAGIHAGRYAEQSALGRAGTAADVAGVVAFLASPDAAYVTGVDIGVDGGVLAAIDHHGAAAAADRWHAARPA